MVHNPSMRYESEMIPPLRRALSQRSNGSVVVEEFGVGYGVADLMMAHPDPAAILARRLDGPWTDLRARVDARILDALRTRPLSRLALAEITGLSHTRVASRIRSLTKAGFTSVGPQGRIGLAGALPPMAREVWAVEAKLRNWLQGACQARRYQHFAHRTYLAIPDDHRSAVKKEFLRRINIGLIAVSKAGARVIFHPRPAQPRSRDLFLLASERIWAVTRSASAAPTASRPRGALPATS